MQKKVQISQELFHDLVRFHLAGAEECGERIRRGLEQKMNAMYDRELFKKYRMSEDESEREEARKKYLDRRGISEDYRW